MYSLASAAQAMTEQSESLWYGMWAAGVNCRGKELWIVVSSYKLQQLNTLGWISCVLVACIVCLQGFDIKLCFSLGVNLLQGDRIIAMTSVKIRHRPL